MITKTFSAPPVRVGNGTATFWISKRGPDLCGDDVQPERMDLSVFKNNPVGLWNHDSSHVIGRWSLPVIVGDGIQATLTFAGTEHAQEKRQLVETGFVKSASIGFDPIEAEPLNPAKPRGPFLFKHWRLIEVSLVATPANASATLIDFQDKSYRLHANMENRTVPLSREERLAKAAEVMRRSERRSEPAAVPGIAPAPTTQAIRAADNLSLREVVDMFYEDSPEIRAAKAARVRAEGRIGNTLADASIEAAVREEKARRNPAPEAPKWARGF